MLQTKEIHYEELDIRTPRNKQFCDRPLQRIKVKSWEEAHKLEEKEEIRFLKFNEWIEYYESKYEIIDKPNASYLDD